MDPNFLKLEIYFIQIPPIVISLLHLTMESLIAIVQRKWNTVKSITPFILQVGQLQTWEKWEQGGRRLCFT